MSTTDELTRHFSEISDAELISRIKSGSLTESAFDIANKELSYREINIDLLLNQAPIETSSTSNRTPIHITVSPIITRILKFPYRAVLGIEPFWVVFIFGVALDYGVGKLVNHFIVQLIFAVPISPNALSLSYLALGLNTISKLWLSIALWRSADNSKIYVINIIARVLAILYTLSAVWGTVTIVNIVKQYVPSDSASIMSHLPKK